MEEMIKFLIKGSCFINCEFNEKPVHNIESMLKSVSNAINFSSAGLAGPDIYEFCRKVNIGPLISLDISNNNIGDKAGWLLAHLLGQYNCSLSYLNLSDTNTGTQTTKALKFCLENDFFDYPFVLILAGNSYTDEAICNLALGISRSNSVKELDISRNKLGLGAIRVVGSLIKYDSKISKISLAYNPTDSEMLKEILYCFCFNFHILSANFSGMNLTDDHMKFLGFYLKSKSIKELLLGDNSITYIGCRHIKKILSYTSTLSHIGLEGNPISSEGLLLLRDANQKNKVLIKPVEEYKSEGF